MGMACSNCAVCKCVFSVGAAPMIALPMTRIMATTGPVASIQNKLPFVNIPPMGLCTSPEYPTMKLPIPIPGPCMPIMTTPWLIGAPTILTSQGPILNNIAKAVCTFRGVVNIVMPGSMPIMTTP
jgi:hypothetical protein